MTSRVDYSASVERARKSVAAVGVEMIVKVGLVPCSSNMTTITPLRVSSLLFRPTSFARTSIQLQNGVSKRRSILWNKTTSHQSYVASLAGHAKRVRSSLPRTQTTRPKAIQQASLRHQSDGATTFKGPSDEYEPPTAGILYYLPSRVVPYAELIRLDKPTGTYYLFLPCLFSTLFAAPLTIPITPPLTVVATSTLFFAGALIMRGAGCTINDLWDRNLDPHVARTRLRPIARGAISVRQAIPFLGIQLLTGLGVLLQFPYECLFYGIPSLLLVGTYPLAKRITNYPQFVLGLTFSWGAIMGFPALGIDLLSNTLAFTAASCLYGSCVAWTIVYDMIYAYQDIRDDAAAGIKSIALAQESNAKGFLSAVSAVQVILLAGAGVAVGAGPVFFAGTCGGAAATLGYMIWKVDLKSVQDCWSWFKKGAWFTGGAISMGLLGDYLAQYFGLYEDERVNERSVAQ